MSLTIGSLFSGIGAFELGLEWAGLGPVIYQVELDEYARKVLAKHWPDVVRRSDVRRCGRRNLERTDVICAGSPCQDFSRSGGQSGLEGSRSGLWHECARIIGEVRPRFFCFENVAQIRTLDGGKHFARILDDLATLGMDAIWWEAGAEDVGAPHLRKRLWLVAYQRGAVGYADRARLARRRLPDAERTDGSVAGSAGGTTTENSAWSALTRLGGSVDGSAGRMDARRWPRGQGAAQHDWEPPRVTLEGRGRRERLACIGNALVPQCAQVAGTIVKMLHEGTLRP